MHEDQANIEILCQYDAKQRATPLETSVLIYHPKSNTLGQYRVSKKKYEMAAEWKNTGICDFVGKGLVFMI